MKGAKKKLGKADFIEEDIILNDDMKRIIVVNEPRRLSFIFVALCTKGHASYTVDTLEQRVTENDVIIITDRHVIDDCSVSDDLEGMCMMISVKYFYEIIRNVSELSSLMLFAKNHPVMRLSDHEAEMFKNYFWLMKDKVADTQNHFRRDVVSTLMLSMVYDLGNVIYRGQQSRESRHSRADAIFSAFIQLLEENFRSQRHIAWYADQLCVSPKYLSETVKNVSKRNPKEWIESYVTLEIKVLLKSSTKTIKEIASALGFANQSFLGSYFKNRTGMSPVAYRRKANNDK